MADLGETLGHYFWLAETVAMKVRNIPDSEAHYDVESKAWTERRLLIPPRDDEEKRKAYFAFCDEICSMNPATPGETIRIYFACWAAAQVIIEQDMLNLSEDERARTFNRANDYVNDKLGQTNGTSTTSLPPNLPEHLRQALEPVSQNKEPAEGLLDQVIQYRSDTGEVKECTVIDYTTSMLGGEWFRITEDPNGNVMEISDSEMNDILTRRIIQLLV